MSVIRMPKFHRQSVSVHGSGIRGSRTICALIGHVQSQFYIKAGKNNSKSTENERVTSKVNEIYSKEPSGLDRIVRELQSLSLTKPQW
jgi:hypothetical protein